MTRPIRVSINVRLDIDPEAWEAVYGVGPDAAAVKVDVREWAFHLLQQAAEMNGVTA